DPAEVGRYLGAVGWAIGRLRPERDDRIVEMGAGWGHLALALAQTGFDVTAVDLNAASVDLLQMRSDAIGVALRIVRSDFLAYEDRGVDLVVFFESFHHCADPAAMLDKCSSMLTDAGRLAFLAEPIFDDFYCPWGVRLDGGATFMTRHAGWLELGFNRSYFRRELNARGFRLEHHSIDAFGEYGTLEIATRTVDGTTFAGLIALDEQATWDPRCGSVGPARVATGHSRITLSAQPQFTSAAVQLVNLGDAAVAVELGVQDERVSCDLLHGQRRTVHLGLAPGRRELTVSSEQVAARSLGLDRIGVCVEAIALS
ncbi:MAG: Methyltransferase type 11, partial [Acidimicrobiales bacterium]|nr:Methyltransferase type 11 [Acidimicrobiales bacterium]